ncbi:3-deoxy-manno-octulosonate cytidylyltransferase [Flocculibacter collagenilyticus]|uniref:3-deoxy-manno-octulosonate cytidylyltransferase n=1 Tax=Flocculibacter collagenilyticus TaxID=2744479 RepID=UPI0018F646D0|nr:3-deoxy-manno-octulosonate cytidylyltransferase [Flocculibacter collagenilyticus]
MEFVVVIPARYDSTRLPGKPLADIAGKPMIEWVHNQALKSGATRVIVATDDKRIEAVVREFGGEVCMTAKDHESGTERLAEVINHYQLDDDTIVVNVQGDEPLIPPANIQQVASGLASSTAGMATLGVAIEDVSEIFDPNAVKLVRDKHNNALYFSRAAIPYDRSLFPKNIDSITSEESNALHNVLPNYLRHIGIYAYRAGFINKYISWDASPLEQIESLEQLRVLWHGEKIHVDVAEEVPPAGVDTPQDLERVRALVSG